MHRNTKETNVRVFKDCHRIRNQLLASTLSDECEHSEYVHCYDDEVWQIFSQVEVTGLKRLKYIYVCLGIFIIVQ